MCRRLHWFTILVVAVSAVAVGIGCSKRDDAGSTPTAASATADDAPSTIEPTGAPARTGAITGQLSYPASALPLDLRVCAEETSTAAISCTADQAFDPESRQRTYRLEVPAGSYLVYAEARGRKAYFSEFVVCGLMVNCESHEPIVVAVEPGETRENVDPGDWYTQ